LSAIQFPQTDVVANFDGVPRASNTVSKKFAEFKAIVRKFSQ